MFNTLDLYHSHVQQNKKNYMYFGLQKISSVHKHPFIFVFSNEKCVSLSFVGGRFVWSFLGRCKRFIPSLIRKPSHWLFAKKNHIITLSFVFNLQETIANQRVDVSSLQREALSTGIETRVCSLRQYVPYDMKAL